MCFTRQLYNQMATLNIRRYILRASQRMVLALTANEVQLEGVVEYKSLPSGLHNIKEDLV